MPFRNSLLRGIGSTVERSLQALEAEIALLEEQLRTPPLHPPTTDEIISHAFSGPYAKLADLSKQIDELKITFYDGLDAPDREHLKGLKLQIGKLDRERAQLHDQVEQQANHLRTKSPNWQALAAPLEEHAEKDHIRRQAWSHRLGDLHRQRDALVIILQDVNYLKKHKKNLSDLSERSEKLLDKVSRVATGQYVTDVANELLDHPYRVNPDYDDVRAIEVDAKALLSEAATQLYGHSTTPKFSAMVDACTKISAAVVDQPSETQDKKVDWATRDEALLAAANFHEQRLHPVYWSSFSASQSLMQTHLRSDLSEDSLTPVLLMKLRDELTSRCAIGLDRLGYLDPIVEIEFYDMAGRVSETATGGDFALILTTDFGAGPTCRYLVVQMKNAGQAEASVYRNDGARQFRHLGRHALAAFYGFFQLQGGVGPAEGRPSASFRPYKSVANDILSRVPGEIRDVPGALAKMSSSEWNVDTFTEALDLPSLIAFALTSDHSEYCASKLNSIDALVEIAGGYDDIGKKVALSMVDIVAVCSIGRPLDLELKKAAARLHIKHYDFSPYDDQPTDDPIPSYSGSHIPGMRSSSDGEV